MNCWSRAYFEHHPMTVQEMTEKYGKPGKIVDLEGGKQVFVHLKLIRMRFCRVPFILSSRMEK
jgi:hypothetical protein